MNKQLLVMLLGLCLTAGYNTLVAAQTEEAQPAVEAAVEAPAQAAADVAAEAPIDDMMMEDDALVSYGTVVEFDDQKIVLLEYDYDTDQEIQVTYALDAQTTFENVASKAEIAVDDDVEIVFKEDNGAKIAVNVVKENYDYDFDAGYEEPAATEGEAAMPAENAEPAPAEDTAY